MSQLQEFNGVWMDGLQFCAKVYELYESIRNQPNGPSQFRKRSSKLVKKLLEELLPICKYIQTSYRPGRYISVCWMDGSQNFDAKIKQRGAYVNDKQYPAEAFLEVTCAMHPKEYLMRELLDTTGSAFGLEGISRHKDKTIKSVPVFNRGREFIEKFSQILIERITAKETIPYPKNTTLIVHCTLNSLYHHDEWQELMSSVIAQLHESQFREIYFYDSRYQHSEVFYSPHVS